MTNIINQKTIELAGIIFPNWKGLLWAGIFVGLLFIFYESRYYAFRKRNIFFVFILQLVFMYLLAKIFFVISHNFLHDDGANFKIAEFWKAGRIYAGALVGFFLAVVFGAWFFDGRKRILNYLDLFSMGHIIIIFFYRVGNSINGSHIGKITEMPWGVAFNGQMRHPVSVYETISIFLLFVVISLLRKSLRFVPGGILFFVVGWISLSRVITDFFRSDDLPVSNFHFQNGLTLNQIFYFTIWFIVVCWFVAVVKKNPAP